MTIRLFFIGCLFVITNNINSSTINKISHSVSEMAYFVDSSVLENHGTIVFSYDYQPRLLKNQLPFSIRATQGFNVNWQKILYQPTKRLRLGLNINIGRIYERSQISNIDKFVFNEDKFDFTSKLITLHVGILAQTTIKKNNFFLVVNYGNFFDGEFSYRYHYVFNQMLNCNSVNFNYAQSYTTERSLPIRVQIGISRHLYKKMKINFAVYNNEFKTTFYQSYNYNYCNNSVSSTNESIGNKIGFNLGLGFKFK